MNTEQPKQIEDAREKAYSVAATQYRKDRRQAFLTAEENRAFKSGFKAGYAAALSWVEIKSGLPTEAGEYWVTTSYTDHTTRTHKPCVVLDTFDPVRGMFESEDIYIKAWMSANQPEPFQPSTEEA